MTHPYASFWKRVASTFIDWLLIAVFTGLVSLLITGKFAGGESFKQANTLLYFLFYGIYSIAFESSRTGATIGKRIMRIRVCTTRHKSMSVAQAALRYFARLLSFLLAGFGCVMALFTVKRQGLHDQIARTLVVETA
jgi:uncharacterized RDD family membrane protein YckC